MFLTQRKFSILIYLKDFQFSFFTSYICDFLFDVSFLFVSSILPAMIDLLSYSINEIWLIKNSYLLRINDFFIYFYNIDLQINFEIKIDNLNSKNMSTWKINISDDYLFVQSDSEIDVCAYSLASRINLINNKDNQEFNDNKIVYEDSWLANTFVVVKYLKKYEFCIGMVVSELGALKNHMYFYNKCRYSLPSNCVDKKGMYFNIFDDGRFITYPSTTGKAVILDHKKRTSKLISSLSFKDIIYISEKEKIVYVNTLDGIIKSNIKELYEIDSLY